MFGKQKRIEALEAENGHLQAELDQLQPWIGLATILRDQTAQFAANTDMDTAVNLAVQSASEEERHKFVTGAFDQLDPERQLELLATTFGDGILKEALEQERQKRIKETEKNHALAGLLDEAREHRRLRFSNIPNDSRVIMHFYDAETLKNTRNYPGRWAQWSRRIEGVMQENRLEVHHDTLRGVKNPKADQYESGESIHISGSESESKPLYYGTEILMPYKPFSGRARLKHNLGPVFINGIDIFDAVPEEYYREKFARPTI